MQGENQSDGVRFARERAHRLFSKEFNASTITMKGDEDKAPLFILTPLGCAVNRLIVVGILADRSQEGKDGTMWSASVADPVGGFRVWAGRFNPQPVTVLSSIRDEDIPVYVSVIGKVRTYSPSEGVTYLSIRPEYINIVDRDAYNYWIIETTRWTKKRINAIEDALTMEDLNVDSLVKLGHDPEVARGAIEAVRRYKNIDTSYYRDALFDALEVASKSEGEQISVPKKDLIPPPEETRQQDEIRIPVSPKERILEFIRSAGKNKTEGISHKELREFAEKNGISSTNLDMMLETLMNEGEIYQPTGDTYRSLS